MSVHIRICIVYRPWYQRIRSFFRVVHDVVYPGFVPHWQLVSSTHLNRVSVRRILILSLIGFRNCENRSMRNMVGSVICRLSFSIHVYTVNTYSDMNTNQIRVEECYDFRLFYVINVSLTIQIINIQKNRAELCRDCQCSSTFVLCTKRTAVVNYQIWN